MSINQIEYINKKFNADLTNRLMGRVFHLTPTNTFYQIQKDGIIHHNQSGKLGLNTSSNASFGRQNGWVCLFDLRDCSIKEIKEALNKYYFLRPEWFIKRTYEFSESNVTYMFLDPTFYNDIIPNSRGILGKFYIPRVECWYPGRLNIELIEEALSVRIFKDATESDRIGYMMSKM
jgi:hypothetical protein